MDNGLTELSAVRGLRGVPGVLRAPSGTPLHPVGLIASVVLLVRLATVVSSLCYYALSVWDAWFRHPLAALSKIGDVCYLHLQP
ncbi:hypothetical protein FA13DRAFT_1741613 [Coprinellus micaceus]|uniref:Uncharacterized protein n=1 Tax=Coprinellus micaceus TaxID=71717 RepID=A0A4Y7SIL5_COPMI|nr:hypothetical protein FA13DRAFT_1743493 [Coprinellus micaceus]TEB21693.1 hypothetical protein FA13DRAFT_1741613 [Coprinellus micaceus]